MIPAGLEVPTTLTVESSFETSVDQSADPTAEMSVCQPVYLSVFIVYLSLDQ